MAMPLPSRLAAAALLAGVAALAQAQYVGPSATPPTTVAEILKNPVDDQRVTLRGTLVNQISRDKYTFSDGTGEIRVEIDDDDFPRQKIDANTRIEIVGEVEKDAREPVEIDVDRVRVLD